MLTHDGRQQVAQALEGMLEGALIEVSDGEQAARSPAELELGDTTVTVVATFGEQDAVFDWRRRTVLLDDGRLQFDVDEGDFGRKPLGAIWTCEAIIEVPEAA